MKGRKNHNYRHGDCVGGISAMYISWYNMKSRCNYSYHKSYKNYGGRGITYDPKWETFKSFKEDMGKSWRKGLTIERIDNNGNYCKENCKWITKSKQMVNTRHNRFIEYKGEKLSVASWSRKLGLSVKTLTTRIDRWSIEKAFNTPVRKLNYHR